ncbi:MAG: GDP-mannose 4,6-dehydratase [Thermodesulfobacteriota bacterium]|nr:GDP-mannose 4,6-dehydratase [Thermodesulfobacteriota bacterium]
MRWLITGGCGFIGRSLIKNLLAEGGHAIRIVDNLSVGSRQELALITDFAEPAVVEPGELSPDSMVQLIVGDILNEKLALDSAQGVDIIVHLAANTGVGPSVDNPRMDCVINVLGTFNYLEAARVNHVARFVFASSGAPAGECEPPIHEELPPHPVSPYGASKLAGEGYCSAYFRTYGVDTVALRFSNVYGPLSAKKESVVAKFIKRAMAGETLEIYGDGLQTRDFLHIDDLIHAVRLASTTPDIGGETFQIAAARETTVGEIADRLRHLFQEIDPKNNIRIVYMESRLGDVKRNFSDTSKAKARLGWQPEVPLERGLQATLDWFVDA